MSAILDGIRPADRARITKGMRERADAAGLPLHDLWHAAINSFTPETIVTPATLIARVIKCSHLLNVPVVTKSQPAAAPEGPRKHHRTLRRQRRCRTECANLTDYWSRGDVAAMWDAASVLQQAHKKLFNTLIVLRHVKLGQDQEIGSIQAADLIHGASQHLRRVSLGGVRLHYILRHRLTAQDGFTSAIVCHIPVEWADEMHNWFDGFLDRRFGAPRPADAVHIRLTEYASLENRFRRHWRLIRMLSGALDPTIEVVYQGRRRCLLDVLGVPRCLRIAGQSLTISCRYQVACTIGRGATKGAAAERLAFLSAFRDGAWEHLTNRWEWMEFPDRLREQHERDAAQALVLAQWPAGVSPRHDQIRAAELARLAATWSPDPRQRLRSWRGWWLPPTAT